jgi:hypothetical protein
MHGGATENPVGKPLVLGPVFQREATRADRRLWLHICRWGVGGFLCLLLLATVVEPVRYPTSLDLDFTHRLLAWAEGLSAFLLPLEYFLILLLAPALSAGGITEEKTTGSLQLLLAAGLTSWDILAGKLLGRLFPVLYLLLTVLPGLCFCAALTDQPPLALAAMVLPPFLLLYAVGAVGLLVSVWSRTTNRRCSASTRSGRPWCWPSGGSAAPCHTCLLSFFWAPATCRRGCCPGACSGS